MRSFLITGVAGFIGSNLADSLLMQGHQVVGIDNFDAFYDRATKLSNISQALGEKNFHFIEGDLLDISFLHSVFEKHSFDGVIHLAARAGVRPSIENPVQYLEHNVLATQHLLGCLKKHPSSRLIIASSSSVYGETANFPWNESNSTLQPISQYAASKIACEVLARVHSHLYKLPTICLRFFTVYGPRQRPDLAIHTFFDKILHDKAIDVFGNGETMRDYTYIDDITQGISHCLQLEHSGFEIFNLGNHQPVSLNELLNAIEKTTGLRFKKNQLPPQAGDVQTTCADIDKARSFLGFVPSTDLLKGLNLFYQWHRKKMQDFTLRESQPFLRTSKRVKHANK